VSKKDNPDLIEEEVLELPTKEELEEKIEEAESLLEKVIDYRDAAGAIDQQVRENSERYVPLDDLPYGEEMIRTEDFDKQLSRVITKLKDAFELPPEKLPDILSKATKLIEMVESTLDECTPLQQEDVEEDY
jgi:hypothetical protein